MHTLGLTMALALVVQSASAQRSQANDNMSDETRANFAALKADAARTPTKKSNLAERTPMYWRWASAPAFWNWKPTNYGAIE